MLLPSPNRPRSALGEGPLSALGEGPLSALGEGPRSALGEGSLSALGEGLPTEPRLCQALPRAKSKGDLRRTK